MFTIVGPSCYSFRDSTVSSKKGLQSRTFFEYGKDWTYSFLCVCYTLLKHPLLFDVPRGLGL